MNGREQIGDTVEATTQPARLVKLFLISQVTDFVWAARSIHGSLLSEGQRWASFLRERDEWRLR